MLVDLVHGDEVEVDLLVQNQVGSVDVVVGFECTASSRPATVEWAREMLAKHETLPIDKTVLVARAGFTKAARARAAARNALALSLEEATDADWLKFVQGLSNLHVGSFHFRILGGSANVSPGDLQQLAEGQSIRLPRLGVAITMAEYVQSIVSQPSLFRKIFHHWLSTPEQDRKDLFPLSINFQPHDHPEALGADGIWRELNHVDVRIEVSVKRTRLELATASFDGHQLAYGTAPNIFGDIQPTAQHVLINLVGQGGRPSKAALLFPGSSSGAPRILDMSIEPPSDAEAGAS